MKQLIILLVLLLVGCSSEWKKDMAFCEKYNPNISEYSFSYYGSGKCYYHYENSTLIEGCGKSDNCITEYCSFCVFCEGGMDEHGLCNSIINQIEVRVD